MAWKEVKEKDGYEIAFRWFYSKKKAEVFCMRKIRGEPGQAPRLSYL
tara:strand:- start:295 stop:435 length:141 start_codon:yes stop_codon:yes gene_type:complete